MQRLTTYKDVSINDFIVALVDKDVGVNEETRVTVNSVYKIIGFNNSNRIGFYAEFTDNYISPSRNFGIVYTSQVCLFRKAYKNEEKLCKD